MPHNGNFAKIFQIARNHGIKVLIIRAAKYAAFLIRSRVKQYLVYLSKILTFVHKGRLSQILNKNDTVVIVKSYHPWHYIMFQRPPQIARFLSDFGYKVFFLQNEVKRNFFSGFFKIKDGCYVTHRQDLLDSLSQKKILIFNSIDKLFDYQQFSASLRIYDYIDIIHPDIYQSEVKDDVLNWHKGILKNTDIPVTVISKELMNEAGGYRKLNLELITNGVEPDHFKKQCDGFKAYDFDSIPKPIIGYYGTLAKWVDYRLIMKIAAAYPEASVVLIGLVGDNSIYDYDLESYPNIRIYGPVDYSVLPCYARHFDVSIIPFKKYDVTDSASPIKIFEYMALGKPVISSNINEATRYHSILAAGNHDEFIQNIAKGLALIGDNQYANMLENDALKNTWNRKAKQFDEIIKKYFQINH